MIRAAGLSIALVTLAACVPRTEPPSPVAAPPPVVQRAPVAQRPPVAQPHPAPASVAAPVTAGATAWLDAPLSPGTWSYRRAAGGSSASFGPRAAPVLVIACEPGRRVSITRSGAGGSPLTFRTSSASRMLSAGSLSAADPLLDALAFSRGRFAVETAGAPALIVPAWPELARVVEDCRR